MKLPASEVDTILKILLIGALPLGFLIERTLDLSLQKTLRMRRLNNSRMTRFFSNGLTLFVLTLTASLAALLPIVLRYGVGDLITFLTGMRRELIFFGWPLTFLVLTYVVAPFAVGACALYEWLVPKQAHMLVGAKFVDLKVRR